MRVLFISANTDRSNMPVIPLGLGLVAAAARRAGHDVAFLDLLSEPDPLSAVQGAIAAHDPEVIGVSVRNVDDQCEQNPRFLLQEARAVVDQCRACSPALIVVGGAGYSIFPREALRYLGADFGVAGDGEVTSRGSLSTYASEGLQANLPVSIYRSTDRTENLLFRISTASRCGTRPCPVLTGPSGSLSRAGAAVQTIAPTVPHRVFRDGELGLLVDSNAGFSR